jgi:hypothetical protein
MNEKDTKNLEFATIFGNASNSQSKGKDHIVQSSSFRLIFSFINLYALITIALFFLVKGNLVGGVNTNFLEQGGFLYVLNARAIILLLLLIFLNVSAYYNYGFKYACLVLIVYMLNSAIDNAVLYSGFMHLTDRPYLSAFAITRPLFIISLFWVMTIHKYKFKSG